MVHQLATALRRRRAASSSSTTCTTYSLQLAPRIADVAVSNSPSLEAGELRRGAEPNLQSELLADARGKAHVILLSLRCVGAAMSDGRRQSELAMIDWGERPRIEGSTDRNRGVRVSDGQVMSSSDNADKMAILVVEGDIMVRAYLSDSLRDQGHMVIQAVNADEALAILRSHLKVDLVLTDMRMRGMMDGVSLVRLIRAELPFLKVVMVATESPDSEVRQLLDGYLSKPVRPSQLRSLVSTIFPGSAAETDRD